MEECSIINGRCRTEREKYCNVVIYSLGNPNNSNFEPTSLDFLKKQKRSPKRFMHVHLINSRIYYKTSTLHNKFSMGWNSHFC